MKEAGNPRANHHAALVASGILLSRIAGLLRDRVFAHYFGSSDAADAFRAAFRIPNLLQNLFGEGALSASFIPVYANLLARKDEDEADDVACAVFCLLTLAMSCLVLIGILATPLLTGVVAPGFTGAKLQLTISLVRILFPGAGLLAISAWCLGVLNSHRRFFISYSAPVAWNVMMIVSLVGFGGRLDQFSLTKVLAWGSVAGSALQLGVQLPQVLRLIRRFRLLDRARHGKRPDRGPQLCTDAHQSRRRADQRVRRYAAGKLPPDGRPRRPRLRSNLVHLAGEPFRHVRVRRRIARLCPAPLVKPMKSAPICRAG